MEKLILCGLLVLAILMLVGCAGQKETTGKEVQLPKIETNNSTMTKNASEPLQMDNKTLPPIVNGAGGNKSENKTAATDSTAEPPETIVLVHKLLTDENRQMSFAKYNYTLILEDVMVESSAPSGTCALLEVKDEIRNLPEKIRVCKGTDYMWNSPEGKKFKIRVLGSGVGYSTKSIFAEVAVFEPQ